MFPQSFKSDTVPTVGYVGGAVRMSIDISNFVPKPRFIAWNYRGKQFIMDNDKRWEKYLWNIRGRTFLMGNTRPKCFPQKGQKFWDPLFFRGKFWDPSFFPYKFDTPYFTPKLGLSAFLFSEIVTIFAIFGSVTSKKMEILKKNFGQTLKLI